MTLSANSPSFMFSQSQRWYFLLLNLWQNEFDQIEDQDFALALEEQEQDQLQEMVEEYEFLSELEELEELEKLEKLEPEVSIHNIDSDSLPPILSRPSQRQRSTLSCLHLTI